MQLFDLIIEVTRYCNMNCNHCLRGERQRKKFNTEMLDNIFKDVDYVYGITFTGGEPLTQVNTIIEVLDYIKEHNIGLGYFYIVSNGTIYSRKLMNVLDYFYNYYVDEKEISAFEISQDQYHIELDALRKQNIWKYQDLADAFGYDFIHLENRKKILSVIKEGNARFFLNGRESFYNNGFYNKESDCYGDNRIYVAANGNVISACDLSFDNVDKYSFGNVKDATLVDIIEQNTKDKVEAIQIS